MLYLLNVIDYPPLAFARAETATLLKAFDDVAVMAVPQTLAGQGGGNLVLVASDTALPVAGLRRGRVVAVTVLSHPPDRV